MQQVGPYRLIEPLGGSVAAWQLDRPQGRLDLWRPWDGHTTDRYRLASFREAGIAVAEIGRSSVRYRIGLFAVGEPLLQSGIGHFSSAAFISD